MTIFVGASKRCRKNEPDNKKNRTEEGGFRKKKCFVWGWRVVDRDLGVNLHKDEEMRVGEIAEDNLNTNVTPLES